MPQFSARRLAEGMWVVPAAQAAAFEPFARNEACRLNFFVLKMTEVQPLSRPWQGTD